MRQRFFLVLSLLSLACSSPPSRGGAPASGGTGASPSSGGAGAAASTGGGGSGATGTGELPPDGVPLDGTGQSWGVYDFVVPTGFTSEEYADGFVLSAPHGASQGECSYALLAPVTAEADLVAQALAIGNAFFASAGVELIPPSGYGSSAELSWRGVTGQGLPFVELPAELSSTQGPTGAAARVLVIDLGGQVASVVAFQEKDNPCVGDASTNALSWSEFFYGLSFPGKGGASDAARAALLGKWFRTTGTAATSAVFAANGRYGEEAAYTTYGDYSATEVLETTTAYGGEGAFVVQGNRIGKLPDGKSGQSTFFRVAERPNSAAPGGVLPELSQLKLGIDGKPFELVLVRDFE